MANPFSELEETIFAEKKVLTEHYQPETILERDEEIEHFRFALQDVLRGHDPENIMVYGKAGLGKTAVTRYMVDSLKEETTNRDEADPLYIHWQNCDSKTVFQVVRWLVNEMLPEGASEFPKRGLGTGDAFNELYSQLDRLGGTHLFIFDEIDHLTDANTLLYELPRARSNNHVTGARLGVIGISNNYTFRQSLSAKVKDTLMEKEISFSPYDANELRTILRVRADNAFIDGVDDEAAVSKAAAIAAKDMGNARQAIDLLRVGASIAERQGLKEITGEHIDAAREEVLRGRLSNKIRDQTRHAQYILEAIAVLDQHDETPTRSKQIKPQYEDIADKHGAMPLTTLKSIQDHLADLHMLGFLNRYDRNLGMKGGQYYEYELDIDATVVLETRREIELEERAT